MIKNCKKIILIVLGVLLISGCKAKSETSMIINDDMSINIKGIVGYDDELINAMMSMNESSSLEDFEEVKNYTDEEQRKFLEENFIDTNEAFSSMKNQGFTVQEYQDETYMGYVMSKNIKNIDDFVGDNPDLSISDYDDFNNKKMFKKEGNVYKGKILFNKSETTTEIETYDIELDYKFILTLPNKAISSNATSVSDDGETLTWDLANTNIDAIEFEFEFPSFLTMLKNNMFVVAGIAIFVVLIIVILIVLCISKVKKKKNVTNSGIKENDKSQAIQNMLPIEESNVQSEKPTPVMSEPMVNVQPEVQTPVMSDPMVNVQPEVQTPVMSEPMVSVQPEMQAPVMSEPMVSVQPEMQAPVMSEPMVSVQPEMQTPVMSEPMVSVQPEMQVPVMSEPMVNVQPEMQAPVMSEPMVSVQSEMQAPVMSEPMVSVQPEMQTPVMSEPMVSVQPEMQVPVMSEPMVSVQPEMQAPVMSEPMVNLQPEVQTPVINDPLINEQPKVEKMQTFQKSTSAQNADLNANVNLETSNQDIGSKPLFPQDIIPPNIQ